MARRSKEKEEQERLLALVPDTAKYVQVLSEKGEQKYRLIQDLATTDVIQTGRDGKPIVMKGKPGRPKSVILAPINSVVAEMVKRKQEAIVKDKVLLAVQASPEDTAVLHQVLLALGEEAASLGFDRTEAERGGKETSNISVRRVNTLKAIVDTWLKRKDQIVSRGVDLQAPAFKTLLKFLLETFREAMADSGERPEMVETVFARLAEAMDDGWEVEAKSRMKNDI